VEEKVMTDKILAIVGLVGVSIYAIYQGNGNPESLSLANTIVAAIAGFVTGATITKEKSKDKQKFLPGSDE